MNQSIENIDLPPGKRGKLDDIMFSSESQWWYYDKKDLRSSPSVQDGIEYDLECQFRKEAARFIIDMGNQMDLGYTTMATGVVYFHRFYMVHSFNKFPKFLTASCALFLAGKVEETPKKARDIIKMAEKNLPSSEFIKFGADPKQELLVLERILLQTIKFDLQVEHPYGFMLKYAKSFRNVTSHDRNKMERMLQMAWTFVNDSLCTTLCLQWESEIIAIAMMHLAAKLSKYDINVWAGRVIGHNRWWELFVKGINVDLLEDICHQVLDLYSQRGGNLSAPMAAPTVTSASASTSHSSVQNQIRTHITTGQITSSSTTSNSHNRPTTTVSVPPPSTIDTTSFSQPSETPVPALPMPPVMLPPPVFGTMRPPVFTMPPPGITLPPPPPPPAQNTQYSMPHTSYAPTPHQYVPPPQYPPPQYGSSSY